jgi:hypothetical protein
MQVKQSFAYSSARRFMESSKFQALGKYESRTFLAGEKPQVNARLTGPKVGFKP